MQKLLTIIFLVTTFHLSSMAQEMAQNHSKFAFFVGYQYAHLDYQGANYPSTFANGWNIAVTRNLNDWFGMEVDLSGAYRGPFSATSSYSHSYTYMIGPVFSLKVNRFSPFMHVLLGGSKFERATDYQFCKAVGGGVDVDISRRVALRIIQADRIWNAYEPGPWPGPSDPRQSGLPLRYSGRLSAGVILYF